MRTIDAIVIHCAYTPPDMDVGVEEITRWHTDPEDQDDGSVLYYGEQYPSRDELPEEVRDRHGNGWSDCGYHWVITRDGRREEGRPVDQPGAHVAGHNDTTVGICLVGGKPEQGSGADCNFTAAQWRELERTVKMFHQQTGSLPVYGHRDYDKRRSCPCFDAKAWAQTLPKD